METSAAATQEIRIPHWDCLLEAAAESFGTTCGMELKVTNQAPSGPSDGVIVAVISLVGDVEWAVYLSMPRQTATGVAAKFAGFDIPFESDDMADAIGELTNIFAGKIKAALDRKGVRAEISLPSILRCESLEVLIQHDSTMGRACFESSLGAFWAGVLKSK